MKNKPSVKRFLILSVLLTWCVVLIAARVQRTGSAAYLFLIWNLFLAGLPLFFSSVLRSLTPFRGRQALQLGCFALWLLFLPNSPYILTDFLHLRSPGEAPAWYDIAVLISCAGTGLLLGYLSLADLHEFVSRKFGGIWGWLLALSSLLLSGFALYLGRFLRWNSWDVLVNPRLIPEIVVSLLHPEDHTRAMAVTFVFGTGLMLGYVAARLLLANPDHLRSQND